MRMTPARRLLSTAVAALALLAAACAPGVAPTVGADCGPPPNITSGAQLAGCILSGLDLSGSNLDGADLTGANLSGADLRGASLVDADLTGANLTGADLTGADLSGAVIAGAILLGAIFIDALFGGTIFGFGAVYGGDGLGGTTPAGDNCTGPFCPGYNSATTDTGDYLCTPDEIPGLDGFAVNRSEESLIAAGERSNVTDTATDFTGATFTGGPDDDVSRFGLDYREANFTDTTWIDQVFACASSDGGRFSGTVFTSAQFHHHSARGADFSDATFSSVYLCDTDFTGAHFPRSLWEGFIGGSCAEFLPTEEVLALPDPIVRFDDADFTDSQLGGGAPHPTKGPLTAFTYFEPVTGETRAMSFRGATLDGATITDGLFWNADFAGSTAAGTAFLGNSRFERVIFDPAWISTTWSGSAAFDDATCPDGSSGSAINPCFTVTP